MQIKQLEKGLTSKFEQSHIVFWYDPERSFTELIESIDLNDVVVLNMKNESTLQVKKWILRDNPEQAYLLSFAHRLSCSGTLIWTRKSVQNSLYNKSCNEGSLFT